MPMELLRDIAAGPFPLTLASENAIDKLRVLKAAGMVLAWLPEPGAAQPAVVTELTGLGRASLKLRDVPRPEVQSLPQ